MNNYEISRQIRRRKSRNRKDNYCDSGAARAKTAEPLNDNWFGAENLPPKVIHTASVKRPIHIEPAPQAMRPPRSSEPPQDMDTIFAVIANAYNLTPTQCRQLLQALTNARLILGYRHPVTRSSYPTGAA